MAHKPQRGSTIVTTQLELFPETDIYEELMERASELTNMLMAMRDMLIMFANESEDMSPVRLDEEIAAIESRLTTSIH